MSEGESQKQDEKPSEADGQAPSTPLAGGDGKPAPKKTASPKNAPAPARIAGLDFKYFLWLATIAAAILASVSMLMALGLFILNFICDLVFGFPLVGSANYMGMMRVTGVFTGMSVLTHLFRLRMVAVENSIHAVPFPDEIVASPNTGDPRVDKFECLGRVLINVYDTEVADLILANRERIKEALSAALTLAVSDPVSRYSKEKIEHTLRMGLGGLLPLKSVSTVNLSELRHRVRSSRPQN
ncbi:hypothetical protein [Nisaea denitrificans]|uniref:hypothetical protein n=1 Tax=Nisaea denitrificans TaxID=390877 RepID=UPI00040619F1|nr:hypothetical protein [Nisaea denitrificans]